MKFITKTTWKEVLDAWRMREAEHWGWEEHFKELGYESWDVWRKKWIEKFNLAVREWALYNIDNPAEFLSGTWAGAYKGWQKYLPEGTKSLKFSELIKNPEIAQNGKVQGIIENPAKETTLIVFKLGEEYVLFEGMHRASAFVLAGSEGTPLKTKLTVALTEFSESERELFEQFYNYSFSNSRE